MDMLMLKTQSIPGRPPIVHGFPVQDPTWPMRDWERLCPVGEEERVLIQEYVHPILGEEIESIAGAYIVTREVRMQFRGRDVLVLVGCARAAACCGTGGGTFAFVPGFVAHWKCGQKDGLPISIVEPISDERLRQEIGEAIRRQEGVTQVNFG
jgi:hypothetical protein